VISWFLAQMAGVLVFGEAFYGVWKIHGENTSEGVCSIAKRTPLNAKSVAL